MFAQTQVNSGGTPVIGVAAPAASTSPATANSVGVVQPDNTTITVNGAGVISSNVPNLANTFTKQQSFQGPVAFGAGGTARILPAVQALLGNAPGTYTPSTPTLTYTSTNNITNENFYQTWPNATGPFNSSAYNCTGGIPVAAGPSGNQKGYGVVSQTWLDNGSAFLTSSLTCYFTVDSQSIQLHTLGYTNSFQLSVWNQQIGSYSPATTGGTAAGGSTTTIILASGASTTNGTYNQQYVSILSGTGAGQTRLTNGYTGSSLTANITPAWTTTPDTTSLYTIATTPNYLTGSSTTSTDAGLQVNNANVSYVDWNFGSRQTRLVKLEIQGVFLGVGCDSWCSVMAAPSPYATRMFFLADSFGCAGGTDPNFYKTYNAYPAFVGKYLGVEVIDGCFGTTGIVANKTNLGINYLQRSVPPNNSWLLKNVAVSTQGTFTLTQSGVTTAAIVTNPTVAQLQTAMNNAFGYASCTGSITSGSLTITGVTCSTGTPTFGQYVEGTGINGGSVMESYSGGTITMNNPATATNASVTLTLLNWYVAAHPTQGFWLFSLTNPTSTAPLTVATTGVTGPFTVTQWTGVIKPLVPYDAAGNALPFVIHVQGSFNDDPYAINGGSLQADATTLLTSLVAAFPTATITMNGRPVSNGPMTVPNATDTALINAANAALPKINGVLPFIDLINQTTGAAELQGTSNISTPTFGQTGGSSGAVGTNTDLYVWIDGVHPGLIAGHQHLATTLVNGFQGGPGLYQLLLPQ
jgi:hypothetical protein